MLFDISELKISRHKPFLFAWIMTSYGENVGTDDSMKVGELELEGELEGRVDTDGDVVGHVLPKSIDDSLEKFSLPSIIAISWNRTL